MNDREFLRHTVATVAYRAAKTMRGAPATFADFRPGPGSNTAVQHGAPMKGESYNRADIAAGRVGAEQTPADPRYEFD